MHIRTVRTILFCILTPFTAAFQIHSLVTAQCSKSRRQQGCIHRVVLLNLSGESEEDPRDNFGRFLRGFAKTGMKGTMERGSIVVAKADIPSLNIWMDQTYELRSVYLQGMNPETQMVERISCPSLETNMMSIPNGYTLYVSLFSPVYHDEAIVVTPEEVGLITLKDEVQDSVLMAIPILSFWLAVSYTFASQYNERYGGNFLDAFFGRRYT